MKYIIFLIPFFLSCVTISTKNLEQKIKPLGLVFIQEIGKDILYEPQGISLDLQNIIYVTDKKNRIVKFSEEGDFLEEFGQMDLYSPMDLIIEINFYIYVVDKGNNRIVKYDTRGNFIAEIKEISFNKEIIKFKEIEYICINHFNEIFITDISNHKIFKINTFGEGKIQFGNFGWTQEKFRFPQGIVIDNQENIYIVDKGNSQIKKFDMYGNFILCWGNFGKKEKEFNDPTSLSIDKYENIYVLDSGNSRLQVFDKEGNFINVFAQEELGQSLKLPKDIFISNNFLYISDTLNNRILKYKILY
ncbi:MAG: NHL repeat-containing protein [bacterium]